jgi:hypothetical protein
MVSPIFSRVLLLILLQKNFMIRLGLGLEAFPSSSTLRCILDSRKLEIYYVTRVVFLRYVLLRGYVMWPVGVVVRALVHFHSS